MKDLTKKGLYATGDFDYFLEKRLETAEEYEQGSKYARQDVVEEEDDLEPSVLVEQYSGVSMNDPFDMGEGLTGGVSSEGDADVREREDLAKKEALTLEDYLKEKLDRRNARNTDNQKNEWSVLERWFHTVLGYCLHVFTHRVALKEVRVFYEDEKTAWMKKMQMYLLSYFAVAVVVGALGGFYVGNHVITYVVIPLIFFVGTIVVQRELIWRVMKLAFKEIPKGTTLQEVVRMVREEQQTEDDTLESSFDNYFEEEITDELQDLGIEKEETIDWAKEASSLGIVLEDDDDEEDEGFEEEEEDDETSVGGSDSFLGLRPLEDSPIDMATNQTFWETALEVYKKSEKYAGKGEIWDREEMIRSFAPYLPQNNPSFSKVSSLEPRSVEYNNVAYTIYSAMSRMSGKFKKDESAKLTVLAIDRTALYYKVKVIVPDDYYNAFITKKLCNMIFDNLKLDANDDEVPPVLSAAASGQIEFKLMRNAKKPLTYGDMLRYPGTSNLKKPLLNALIDPKMAIPLAVDLRDSEVPMVIDIGKQTGIKFAGASGSGKSVATFSYCQKLVTLMNPSELALLVLDKKQDATWAVFSKMPHVLGYHYDINTYLDILREVEDERARRQDYLQKAGKGDFKTWRMRCKEDKDYEELAKMPELIVIIDEIAATRGWYKDNGMEDLEVEFTNLMVKISQEGRSAGVHLWLIGQDTLAATVPTTFQASLIFNLKMSREKHFQHWFGDDILKEVSIPTSPGQALIVAEGDGAMTPNLYKTSTIVRPQDDVDQMNGLVRLQMLEWHRRLYNSEELLSPPKTSAFTGKTFLRDKTTLQIRDELARGCVVNQNEELPEYRLGNIKMSSKTAEVVKDVEKAPEEVEDDVMIEEELEEIEEIIFEEDDEIDLSDDESPQEAFIEPLELFEGNYEEEDEKPLESNLEPSKEDVDLDIEMEEKPFSLEEAMRLAGYSDDKGLGVEKELDISEGYEKGIEEGLDILEDDIEILEEKEENSEKPLDILEKNMVKNEVKLDVGREEFDEVEDDLDISEESDDDNMMITLESKTQKEDLKPLKTRENFQKGEKEENVITMITSEKEEKDVVQNVQTVLTRETTQNAQTILREKDEYVPVDKYIVQNGEVVSSGVYRMEKALIRRKYSNQQIKRALDTMQVVEDGNYYEVVM